MSGNTVDFKDSSFKEDVLYEKIDIYQGITPWVHYKMIPIYMILF